MDDGLSFVIYSKANAFRRQFTATGEGTCDLLSNGVSQATFTLNDDHEAVAAIADPGARCAVWFRGVEQFRGRVRLVEGDGPEGTRKATVEADMKKLWEWHGWPVPAAAITAQTSEYRRYSGASETVFKTALAENFTRLGVPWTTATSLGRGSSARVNFRFEPLAELLIPILTARRQVVTISYAPNPVVDIRPAATVAGILTVDSGVVDSFSFSIAGPEATRAIVGGPGEGTARAFKLVTDSARETEWGDIIETFVDAGSADAGDDIAVEGAEALAEMGSKAGVSAVLVETDRFRYLTTYQLGDLVSVHLGPVESVEQITRVSITDTADDGVEVESHIGDIEVNEDTEAVLARQIQRLARGVRTQGRR